MCGVIFGHFGCCINLLHLLLVVPQDTILDNKELPASKCQEY